MTTCPPIPPDRPRSAGAAKQIFVTIDSDYLTSCARIRNVSLTRLITRLVEAIDRDQLVRAVLDDEEHYRERERYAHRFRI